MREIKFRVFDQISKQMSPSFSLFGEFTMIGGVFAWLDGVRGHESNTGLLSLNDLYVMQFTGLKDVNGVCIYEGDIVNFAGGDIRIVKYDRGCFWCENDEKSKDPLWKLTHYCDEYMVIGNIHQNPELLEK